MKRLLRVVALLTLTTLPEKLACQIAEREYLPRDVVVSFAQPVRLARTDTADLPAVARFIEGVSSLTGRAIRQLGDTLVVQVWSGRRIGAPDWEGGFVAVVQGPGVAVTQVRRQAAAPTHATNPRPSLLFIVMALPVLVVVGLALAHR